MNKLLRKAKHPLRFLNHVSIKFFNKKISRLSKIEIFFKNKKGLEIGGPSKIFAKQGYIPIYPLVDSIDGVNFSTLTVWENSILEGQTYNFDGKTKGHQFIKDGTDLSVIGSEVYDFVLSSHSLEHIANPIKALKEWLRVLKKGGVLLLILPDRRFTFDCNRQVTEFDHILSDYKNATTEKDLTHLEEIMSLHSLLHDDGVESLEEFKKRSLDNFTNRCLHHHVFDLNLLDKILRYHNMDIILKEASPPFNLIIMAVKSSLTPTFKKSE